MKLLPEPAACDAAEHGVDAGDEAAEAHLQGEGQVCSPPRVGAVGIDRPYHHGSVAAQVIGQVKQSEEDERGAQHPPETPLLVVRVGATEAEAQFSDTAQAEVADGDQREKESDDAAEEREGEALPAVA